MWNVAEWKDKVGQKCKTEIRTEVAHSTWAQSFLSEILELLVFFPSLPDVCLRIEKSRTRRPPVQGRGKTQALLVLIQRVTHVLDGGSHTGWTSGGSGPWNVLNETQSSE